MRIHFYYFDSFMKISSDGRLTPRNNLMEYGDRFPPVFCRFWIVSDHGFLDVFRSHLFS